MTDHRTRPEGMMPGRGSMLAFWDDVLPAMPDELAQEHLHRGRRARG